MALDRKRKTKDPCPRCFLHLDRCICDLIPRLTLRTRLTLVIHHRELKRTTNTGRLAIESLVNSQMLVRGRPGENLDLSALITDEYRSVLFFPADQATELTHEFIAKDPRPIQLIVPDGNWRQASKVSIRHPELAALDCVKISTPNFATEHLRAEHLKEGMSTLEAIAAALEIIEGPASVKALRQLYDAKLQNTLIGRGQRQK
jgi:DTW domain-containing protein YfiP